MSAVSHLSAATEFVTPSINYSALLPMLIVFGAALVSTVVEAFVSRERRYLVQLPLTVLALLAAFVAVVTVARKNQGHTAGAAVVVDGPTLFLQGSVLALAVTAVLAMGERFGRSQAEAFTQAGASTPGSPHEAAAVRLGATSTEIFPLTLFSVGGMLMFPAAGDLLTMFVALEILSLPLYILTGLARRRRLLSQEASLKYFLLGAFSSAFFLFGAALIYGFAGSIELTKIAAAIGEVNGLDSLAVPGLMLLLVGLLFKVGAVPFHSWTPDVYQGAPTPVTGFMAACTKVAAFGALLRLLYVGFEGLQWNWKPVVAAIAVLTMVVGAVLSVTQTDMKRLLAYSSITHAGFILVGVVALDRSALSGVMFYLLAYGFSTIAAFALISLVRTSGGEAGRLSQWAGLGRRSPLVAAAFSFLLLSFAGIPLTSGFTAKFVVFSPAVQTGAAWLAVVGVLTSAITAFVYARVIVLMYFSSSSDDQQSSGTAVVPSALTAAAITLGVAATVVMGVAPSFLLDLAHSSALFLR